MTDRQTDKWTEFPLIDSTPERGRVKTNDTTERAQTQTQTGVKPVETKSQILPNLFFAGSPK